VYTAEAFAARGLGVSKMTLATRSTHIRANLVSMGGYIATFPHSILCAYADRFSLKALLIRPSRATPGQLSPWLWGTELWVRSLHFILHVRDFAGRRGAGAMLRAPPSEAAAAAQLPTLRVLTTSAAFHGGHAFITPFYDFESPAEARFGRARSAGRTAEGRIL